MPGLFPLDKLQIASWRGVEFIVENVETSGGQKTVVHEYPNSNIRTVESLGIMPDAYNVSAIITGQDYFELKKRLRIEIKRAGIGTFVHPYDGAVECHVDGNYSYTEDDTSLSETIITFRLLVATEEILPQAEPFSLADVQDKADASNASLATGFGETFGVSTPFTQNFVSAESLLDSAGAFFNSQRTVFVQSTETISGVTNVIDNFTADIVRLINAPPELGTTLIDLYQSIVTLYPTAEERFEALKQFFSFGDSDDEINTSTVSLQERKLNQNCIINTIKSGALVEAYRAAAEKEYGTTDEIDEAQEDLEDQFGSILGDTNLDDASNSGLTEETQISLADLRDSVRSFLDNAKLMTAQVVTINTVEMPAQLLSYTYYGSSDNTVEIIELNSIRNPSFVSGEVEILSQ